MPWQCEAAELNVQLSRRDTELQRLRLEEKAAERTLQRICSEIGLLEAECSELEGKRYKLPEDLWHRIFEILIMEQGLQDSIDPLVYYRPVTLSHVCREWREILLNRAGYWSRIVFKGAIADCPGKDVLQAFKERSKATALELVFLSSSTRNSLQELPLVLEHIDFVLSQLRTNRSWKSLVCQHEDPACMSRLMSRLGGFFKELTYLSLSLTRASSGFVTKAEETGQDCSLPCALRHLRLSHISPLQLSTQYLRGLRSLVLISPGKQYCLPLSHILGTLSNTPNLEELVLDDTVPFYDVFLQGQAFSIPADDLFRPFAPVLLPSLRELKWSFLHPKEIFHFLVFINAPHLDTLHLYLNNVERKFALASTLFLEQPLEFTALRELHLLYTDAKAAIWPLRMITFPTIQRLYIDNVDYDYDTDDRGPNLPKAASLFHDQRMPFLTHLSLSRFVLTVEPVRMMLGYLPSLQSLTLDCCRSTTNILDCLTSNSIVGGGGRTFMCPKLDTLVILDCMDLRFDVLREFVAGRNGFVARLPVRPLPMVAPVPVGGGEPPCTPRKIKPLKRGAFASPRPMSVPGSANVSFRKGNASNILLSPAISMNMVGEETKPSTIVAVSVGECPFVSWEQLASLWDLGVERICGKRKGRWVRKVTYEI